MSSIILQSCEPFEGEDGNDGLQKVWEYLFIQAGESEPRSLKTLNLTHKEGHDGISALAASTRYLEGCAPF